MARFSPPSSTSDNAAATGLAYAVAGFAVLSVGDAIIKSMAGAWPAYAVAALRFSIGALALSALLWRSEGPRAFVPANPWLQMGRGGCVALASLCFFSAIYIMPLAEALAIGFLSPILVQVFAGLFLGERVPARVYGYSLLALAGVAIILRPNLALLGWAALLPLVSAVFFALLMVLNRVSAGQGSALSAQVFIAGFSAPILILASLIAKLSGVPELDFGWPSWDIVARCAMVAVTASTAHWLAYLGTAKAGAAQVAPAIYVQMIVAVILGWLFFGDVPDAWTLLGAGLIIVAGLLVWREGVRGAKQAAQESTGSAAKTV
ncbi:MAG: DMT family transporter [Pseudomonadota bacterium]